MSSAGQMSPDILGHAFIVQFTDLFNDRKRGAMRANGAEEAGGCCVAGLPQLEAGHPSTISDAYMWIRMSLVAKRYRKRKAVDLASRRSVYIP